MACLALQHIALHHIALRPPNVQPASLTAAHAAVAATHAAVAATTMAAATTTLQHLGLCRCLLRLRGLGACCGYTRAQLQHATRASHSIGDKVK